MDNDHLPFSSFKPALLSLPFLLMSACIENTEMAGSQFGDSVNDIPPDLPVEKITVTELAYGGTGCPQGTVDWVVSPERDRISVFFDRYIAISNETGGTRVRKACNIGAALVVPEGYSVSLTAVDFRGYTYVPVGGKTQLFAEFFFAGLPYGAIFSQTFEDPLYYIDDDYYVRNEFEESAIIWSACGDDVIMRTNNSIRAYSNEYLEASEILVDSIDAAANLVYRLNWKKCDPGVGV